MGKFLAGILSLFIMNTAYAGFEISNVGSKLQAKGQDISVYGLCERLNANISCTASDAPKAGICFSNNQFTIIPHIPEAEITTIELETKYFSNIKTLPMNTTNKSSLKTSITVFENDEQEIEKIHYLINNTLEGGEVELDLSEGQISGSLSGYMFNVGWGTKVKLECTHL